MGIMVTKHRSGSLYKRGNVYWLKYMVDGKRVYQSLDTKILAEAEKKRAETMRPIMAAETVDALAVLTRRLDTARTEEQRLADEASPPLKLADAWDAYLKAHNRPDTGEATLAQYQVQFDRFTKWVAGKYPDKQFLRDIDESVAAEFIGWLVEGKRSGNTINKYRNLLSLVFETLKAKARLTINPWTGIQRRKQKTQSRRELTVDELKQVCGAAQGELRLLFALGIYTGMRLGDCATLRWGEVDLQRNRISRVPSKLENREGVKPLVLGIHPVLAGMLAEIPKAGRRGFVLPQTAERYIRRRTDVTHDIQAHFKTCKIDTLGDARGRSRAAVVVGFHSLRHTFVSMQAESGTPLSVVQAIVGHGNPAMTRHYTHISEKAATSAIQLLPAVIGEHAAATQKKYDLPTPVREKLLAMTPENWNAIRDELIAGT